MAWREADGTYVGGKRSGQKRGHGAPNKTVILGMLERGGEIMTKPKTLKEVPLFIPMNSVHITA